MDLAHGVKEKEYAMAFIDCRMRKPPIFDFNIRAKTKAMWIYEKYRAKR